MSNLDKNRRKSIYEQQEKRQTGEGGEIGRSLPWGRPPSARSSPVVRLPRRQCDMSTRIRPGRPFAGIQEAIVCCLLEQNKAGARGMIGSPFSL